MKGPRVDAGVKTGDYGVVRWIFIGLISLVMTVAMPMGLALSPGLKNPMVMAVAKTPQALTQDLIRENSVGENLTGENLIREGMAHYEAQQFQAAIEQWQQASIGFETEGDFWGKASTLGYLSLAYQQLGELAQAEESLKESLKYIDSVRESAFSTGQNIVYARVLNTQGKQHWLKGNTQAALETWQASEQAYRQAQDSGGIAIAQINQARALQYLGLNAQAQAVLQEVYRHIQQQPDTELRAAGLRHLSSVLRQLGDLETAQSLLQESLTLATLPDSQSLVFLELGNTAWVMSNRQAAIGRSTEAQQHFQAAQVAYQQALDTDNNLSARLNLLRLWIDKRDWNEAIQSLPMTLQVIDVQPHSRATIYANIHLAESLLKLTDAKQAASQQNFPSNGLSSELLNHMAIAQRLSAAFSQAQTLADKRAESYALGQLAHLYEQTQQWTEAQSLSQRALFALETVQAPELRYRWEWQLGRLSQKQADLSGAIPFYEAAVDSLQQVRRDLLTVNSEVQFSFRDDVEPVYRQYIELLLSVPNIDQHKNYPQAQQLVRAIQTVDRLQLAEIENYLGCALTQMSQVEQVQDPKTALLYPIVLSDRVAMIAQLPQKSEALAYYETAVSRATFEATLTALQTNLATPGRTPEVLENAQKVYDWLIRPLGADLSEASVQTLVFVLDGALRNIPMSVLHDGEQYLIEKGYAVAIAPRLQMFSPGAIRSPLKVKIGGVGIPQMIDDTQFPPIAKLNEELEGIAQHVQVSAPLLNESFTTNNIRQQLQTGDFSAIHWKTHGVFSSDPQETYIVAYNEQIVAQALNNLIQLGSQNGVQPLELLVLSACETAQGDSRAVLGLAGLAARTGTRSVLSTLWIAQDTPNTDFMTHFYEKLSQPNMTIAQSVRQAQLALMNEDGYTTPYIWSNYVLVGNWL
ncbi:MAG: CHAT domain-containing protein [Cyanobacteria bacterium J06650_10]